MKLNSKLLLSSTFVGLTFMFSGCSDGKDGGTVLINTSVESIVCTDGGTKIDIGLDDNGDGILDASEVDSIEYICNGIDGVDGADGADGVDGAPGADGTDGVDGAPGADGVDGAPGADGADGVDGEPGADGADGVDGAPGADGIDGLTTLINLTPLLEGDVNCSAGGVRIDVGLDDDGNGTLEDSEIDDTAYVCNGEAPLSEEEQCLLDTGYGTVEVAGRTWLDRNLGASQIATNADDTLAYGDLYQWGRLADGHEARDSNTTIAQATTLIPGHSDFIITDFFGIDWTSIDADGTQRSTILSTAYNEDTNPNQVCPCGYIVPTETDFTSLTLTEMAALNLTNTGIRNGDFGNVEGTGSEGNYWTSTTSGGASGIGSPLSVRILVILDANLVLSLPDIRNNGTAVRCIKPQP